MYCNNCGERLNELAKYCPRCGHSLANQIPHNDLKTASIIVGIFALISILSIIFIPFAIIEGIVGLILAICAHKKSSNVLGIVLNALAIFFSLLFIIGVIMLYVSFDKGEPLPYIQEQYYDKI